MSRRAPQSPRSPLRPHGRVLARRGTGLQVVPGADRAPASVDSAAVLMVGLTGGIGSGKSTVAAPARRAGRGRRSTPTRSPAEVVEPGTPALAALVERFGAEILGPDGRSTGPRWPSGRSSTTRRASELEAITHPAIGEEFLRQVAAAPADGGRRPRRAAARRVEEPRLRVRRGDRGRGAEGGAAGPARGARHPARPTPSGAWRCRRPTRSAGRSPPGSSTTPATSTRSQRQVDAIWPELRVAGRADAWR